MMKFKKVSEEMTLDKMKKAVDSNYDIALNFKAECEIALRLSEAQHLIVNDNIFLADKILNNILKNERMTINQAKYALNLKQLIQDKYNEIADEVAENDND